MQKKLKDSKDMVVQVTELGYGKLETNSKILIHKPVIINSHIYVEYLIWARHSKSQAPKYNVRD